MDLLEGVVTLRAVLCISCSVEGAGELGLTSFGPGSLSRGFFLLLLEEWIKWVTVKEAKL